MHTGATRRVKGSSGGPPSGPSHATSSWAPTARARTERAAESVRSRTWGTPIGDYRPERILPSSPPPRHTTLLRTARQEHLPATAQSRQPTTGGGEGAGARWPGTTVARRDRRPPAAGRQRHCARPPRSRCAGGGGQGSQVEIPRGPHPPPAPLPPRGLGCRQAARKESGWGGSARQAGGAASERPPGPPPPLPHLSPSTPRNPASGQDWLVRALSSPRLRPPQRPNPAPAAVSPARPVRAHDVWGPPKGLVGGPIRGVSPPSAPRPPTPPYGGGRASPAEVGRRWRGTSGAVSASLDTALWAMQGVGGLSRTAAGGGVEATAAPASSFVSAPRACSPQLYISRRRRKAPSRTPRARVAAVDDVAVDGVPVASSVGVRVLPGRQGGACVSVPPRSNLPDRTLAPLLSPSPPSSLAFPSAVCSQKLALP